MNDIARIYDALTTLAKHANTQQAAALLSVAPPTESQRRVALVISQIKDFLSKLSKEADSGDAARTLAACLPHGLLSSVDRSLFKTLVNARLSELHYEARHREFSGMVTEIENSNGNDMRGHFLSSYEADVDSAIDGKDRARSQIHRALVEIAIVVGKNGNPK